MKKLMLSIFIILLLSGYSQSQDKLCNIETILTAFIYDSEDNMGFLYVGNPFIGIDYIDTNRNDIENFPIEVVNIVMVTSHSRGYLSVFYITPINENVYAMLAYNYIERTETDITNIPCNIYLIETRNLILLLENFSNGS